MNVLFNQRFLLGVYAPIILEFIVYAIYASASGVGLNVGIILWALMLSAPALFFYMISPMLIYSISGVSKFYKRNLQENIDSLFIFSDDIESLKEGQRKQIRDAIETQLIPQLVKNVRGLYIDSYISRDNRTRRDNLLSGFETLFLFSIMWGFLSLTNLIGVVILHFTPISLDFIVLDQISNPINVAIFALIFALFTALSDFVAYYSISRLRKLILDSLPIVVHIAEEERMKRHNYIRSISQFPMESLVGDRTIRKHSRRIDAIYQQQYQEPLSEAIQFYARNQVAKQQAWRTYKPILEELKVPAEQTAVIKDRFFESPFYEIARGVFNYEHEVSSLKTDLEYVKNRLNLWEETSEEEQAIALLFLFRSTEQLFKSILDRLGVPVEAYTNFSMILSALEEHEIITAEDIDSLDNIRKKRNTLVHQPGRVVTLEKEELEAFLKSLERILISLKSYEFILNK